MVDKPSIYRAEAWGYLNAAKESEGPPLSPLPGGLEFSFQLLAVSGLALLLFALVGRVGEFASGVGVVRNRGLAVVVAPHAAAVEEVRVAVGDRVEAGDVLLVLASPEEAATLFRLRSARRSSLTRYLTAPRSTGLRDELVRVNSEIEEIDARARTREVRAPQAGTVTDLRARSGQAVALGDALLAVDPGAPEAVLEASLPGSFAPLLVAGMPLRVEVDGYSDVVEIVPLASMGGQAVSPEEVKRTLGDPVGISASDLLGPQILVSGVLPKTVRSHGKPILLHDGMTVKVHAEVRRVRIVEALFPWFKELGT